MVCVLIRVSLLWDARFICRSYQATGLCRSLKAEHCTALAQLWSQRNSQPGGPTPCEWVSFLSCGMRCIGPTEVFTPAKINVEPEDYFVFLYNPEWFSGSMLIFQGVVLTHNLEEGNINFQVDLGVARLVQRCVAVCSLSSYQLLCISAEVKAAAYRSTGLGRSPSLPLVLWDSHTTSGWYKTYGFNRCMVATLSLLVVGCACCGCVCVWVCARSSHRSG